MIIVTYNFINNLFDNLQILYLIDGKVAYERICKFYILQQDVIYLQTYTRILSYLIILFTIYYNVKIILNSSCQLSLFSHKFAKITYLLSNLCGDHIHK